MKEITGKYLSKRITYWLYTDPEFRKFIEENRPNWIHKQNPANPEQNKKDIINFVITNKRKPSQCSKDKEEKRLAISMISYCSPSSGCFDPEFKKIIDSYGYNNDSEQNKKDIANFININKRKPSAYSKDKEEKRLAISMISYCSPSHGSFDPEFKKLIDSYGYNNDSEQNKKDIANFININKRKPSQCSKDKTEKKLAMFMQSYCSPNSNCFDPEFKKLIDSYGYNHDNSEQNKKDIINFINTNKRKPSQHSKDKEERRLAISMGSYCSPSHGSFDPEFKKLIDSYGYNNDSEQNKKDIINFINTNKRKPSQHSKDKEERRLGVLMSKYCAPSSDCFDPEFKKLIDSYGYTTDFRLQQNKNNIVNFMNTNKRKPSVCSKDKEERKLAYSMQNYCSPSSSCFDPEFKNKINQLLKDYEK